MFRLEGKVIQVNLNPSINIIEFGCTTQKEGLQFYIANSSQETSFSIPVENIPNNPIEGKRLQKELEGERVIYETDTYREEKRLRQTQKLSVMTGKLKGLELEYLGYPVDN
jgi:hypothetical protein